MILEILLLVPPKEGQNPLMSILPFILIIGIFYFFMLRPQIKKQKEIKNFRENLKKGDKIITIGGIHGKIVETYEKTFLIEADGSSVRLKIEKSAIALNSNELMSEEKKS